MKSQRAWDGFDVWVIDAASGSVEPVEFEATSPVPAVSAVAVQRKAVKPAAPKKRRLAKKVTGKPRAAKKPRAPKTAKRVVKKPAGTKKLASLRRRVRPKTKRAGAKQPVLATTASSPAAAAPAPAPIERRPKPLKRLAPTPPPPPPPALEPAPLEPSVAAAFSGLAGPSSGPGDEPMMVLELRPNDRPTPRPGTIDIRFVDLQE